MAIKVLYVIDHMGLGGGQMSVKGIIDNINDKQVETFLCELRKNPPTIAVKGKFISLKYGRYDPRTVLAIARLCKKYKIDILHPQLSKSIITCLLASFICKTPVVIHERGAIYEKGAFFSVYRFLLRLLHHTAAAIIANSQAVALELASKASVEKNNIRVVYNPVDFEIFNPEKVSRKQSRKNLGISDEDFVVGFVGRLHPTKGVDILIKAVSLLLQQCPHYLLIAAGDGPQRKSLENLTTQLGIASRVRFLGRCDNIPEVMAAFNVGVIASRWKLFGKSAPEIQLNWGGRVAIELMRMKIPIISSGKEGLSELLTDELTALLTQQDSPEDIAAAIQRLADDKKLQKRLIDNAYSFSEQFNAKEQARKIEKIYNEVLGDCKGL